jgi:hypothetical protein
VNGNVAPFQISLRASDPRIYSADEKTITMTLVSNTPVTTSAVASTANRNTGNYLAPITFRVGDLTGAGSWSVTGLQINFTMYATYISYQGTLTGGAGVWYELDMANGTIKDQDGLSALDSNWNVPSLSTGIASAYYPPSQMHAGDPRIFCTNKTGTPQVRWSWRDAWV